jgi:hypothetical protein
MVIMANRKIRYRIPKNPLVTQSALIGDPNRSSGPAVLPAARPTSAIARIIAHAGRKNRTLTKKDAARALRLIRLLIRSGYSYKGALKALFGDPLFYALSPPDSVYADFSPLTLQASNSHTLETPMGAAIYSISSRNVGAKTALRQLIENVPSMHARRLLQSLPII